MLSDIFVALVALLIVYAISFGVFAAIVWIICAVLAIKFVLRYVIAAYLICLLLKWVWDTK